ncbi:MAG: hypothetical protein JWR83_1309 [Aeromicrobium sp.]|nr:hypothetical protein [Aeromicrobium sp.]
MRDLPTWLRLFVLGMFWGTGCGGVSAAVVIFASGFNTGGDSAYQLLVGVPLEVALVCSIGAKAGAALGCVTGLLAGLVLTAAVRVTPPRVASLTTVAVVLLVQVLVEVWIAGMPTASNLWAYAAVPAIAFLPMTYVVLDEVGHSPSVVTV